MTVAKPVLFLFFFINTFKRGRKNGRKGKIVLECCFE